MIVSHCNLVLYIALSVVVCDDGARAQDPALAQIVAGIELLFALP